MSLWRYRERLPVEPLVTMGGGDTPLVQAGHLSELPARTCGSLEGAGPTGSFKDRGMTVAVSARSGGPGGALRLDREYLGLGGLRRAGRTRCAVIPWGQDRDRQARPAMMYGARVAALRGNFDRALGSSAMWHGDGRLVNSVSPLRIEGQKTVAYEVCDDLGEASGRALLPVGNAGNLTAWWKGFRAHAVAPRLHGYQAEGAAPLVRGAPVEHPETVATAIRIGNPARWEEAMARSPNRGARSELSPTRRSSTPTAARRARGGVLRAGVGRDRRRAAQVRRRGSRRLRAHGARAQGPTDRDEPRGERRALRARRRAWSPGGAGVHLGVRWCARRRPRRIWAPATTCSPSRSRPCSTWRSRRAGSSR